MGQLIGCELRGLHRIRLKQIRHDLFLPDPTVVHYQQTSCRPILAANYAPYYSGYLLCLRFHLARSMFTGHLIIPLRLCAFDPEIPETSDKLHHSIVFQSKVDKKAARELAASQLYPAGVSTHGVSIDTGPIREP